MPYSFSVFDLFSSLNDKSIKIKVIMNSKIPANIPIIIFFWKVIGSFVDNVFLMFSSSFFVISLINSSSSMIKKLKY